MDTLTALARYEQTIKRSRFVAAACPCADQAQAEDLITRLACAGARHHCWAWKIGNSYRFSDADEPAGTAGRPILQAIEHQGLDQVTVVVSRWFGGIKLGTGGLVRAYGGTAAECLRRAARKPLVATIDIALSIPFDAIADTYRLAEKHGAEKIRESYTDTGVALVLRLPARQRAAFLRALSNATRGSAVLGAA